MTQEINYWSLIEPVCLPLNHTWDDDPDEFVRQFRSIRPEVGHLYAAYWCHEEVCNGGLFQFFHNPTGLMAPEALEGFRAIGAAVWADVLAEAMTFFGTPYPRDWEKRIALMPSWEDRAGGQLLFDSLDKKFFSWDDWEEVADAYAQRLVAGRGQ